MGKFPRLFSGSSTKHAEHRAIGEGRIQRGRHSSAWVIVEFLERSARTIPQRGKHRQLFMSLIMTEISVAAASSRARPLARQLAEEAPHAVHDSGLRLGGMSVSRGRRRGRRSGGRRERTAIRDGLRRRRIHVAVKFGSGAQTDFAHQPDCLGRRVRRRLRRISVKTERRHQNRIDRLLGRGNRGR